MSRLKHVRIQPAKSIDDGRITDLLSILCILIEVLSRAHAKGGGGGGGEGRRVGGGGGGPW